MNKKAKTDVNNEFLQYMIHYFGISFKDDNDTFDSLRAFDFIDRFEINIDYKHKSVQTHCYLLNGIVYTSYCEISEGHLKHELMEDLIEEDAIEKTRYEILDRIHFMLTFIDHGKNKIIKTKTNKRTKPYITVNNICDKKKEMFLYRDHRGSLDESMKTVTPFDSIEGLISHINKNSSAIKKIVNLKFEYCNYDERINWDTYYVLGRYQGESNFYVLGMSNGMINK